MENNKKPNIKIIVFCTITVILFAIIFKITSSVNSSSYKEGVILSRKEDIKIVNEWESKNIYGVYADNKLLKSFDNLDDAKYYADMFVDSYIKQSGNDQIIWHNEPHFYLYRSDKITEKFQTYKEAIDVAKRYEDSSVYSFKTNALVWSNTSQIQESVILEVPFIQQLPELPRGCEVTSLTMLLNYLDINTNKMKLAEQIDKDLTPYEIKNGVKYFGDPSIGFLGSMSDTTKPGYGANHMPIAKLFREYIGDLAIDITGTEFEDLYYFINQKAPIWVITNTDLKKLDESEFYTWLTPSGETIRATDKEHSILITGYDTEYIYINDPLYNKPNRAILKQDFIEAWEQMGKQAVTYIPN